jgi:anti-anti-sigma factor
MTINETKRENVTVVQPSGKLDSLSSPDLDKRLTVLIESGIRQLAVDLSALEYISSAGLRVFLSAAKRMQPVQGKIVLAAPSAQVQQIFDIAGFTSILPICKTVNEACAACAV